MRKNSERPRRVPGRAFPLRDWIDTRAGKWIAATAGIAFLIGAGYSMEEPLTPESAYRLILAAGPPIRGKPPFPSHRTAPQAGPAQAAEDVVSLATRLSADGQPRLLITAASEIGGEAVRSIAIDAGNLDIADFGHLPEGWTGVLDQGRALLSGPPIDAENLFARLDLQGLPDLPNLDVDLRSEIASLLQIPAPLQNLPPLQIIRELEDVLHFPWQVSPGERVQMQVASPSLTPAGGTWRIAGLEPDVLPSLSGDAGDVVQMALTIPQDLGPGSALAVEWTDPFGETVVDIPDAEVMVREAPRGAPAEPELTDCTPTGFANRVICVCGWFPDEASREALRFDGEPIGPPVASSSHSVLVRIPEGTAPGRHTITGDPGTGYLEQDRVSVLVLAVSGQVDQEKLALGEVTPLQLEIQGDTRPFDIVLTNRNPNTVAVTGGIIQTLRTSGGTSNTVSTNVQGISPGQFAIHYKLAEDPCPCAGEGSRTRGVLADDQPSQPESDPEAEPNPEDTPPEQTDSTRTSPPDPEETPQDTTIVPGEDPPPTWEEEEEEEEPCCGFAPDGSITFPRITDPMTPAEVLVAPRDPAVGAFQVLLHSGAYFHNQLDLEVDAVGLPFRFARHYKGDVETEAGGLLGSRWDHSLNKRMVPQASEDLLNGLRRERPEFEDAALWYFDGQGRGALYQGPTSEWREVLNFGKREAFRAFVTTFTPHPGDFFEIQRYVLEDPAEHPFIDHPAVDGEHGEAIFYVLRERNGIRYVFNCRGQLILVLHRNDEASLAGAGVGQPSGRVRITLYYDGPINPLTQNRVLSEVVDPTGETYVFKTDPMGDAPLDTNLDCIPRTGSFPIPRLSEIQGADRLLRFTYRMAETGDPLLESVTDIATPGGPGSTGAEAAPSTAFPPVGANARVTRYAYDEAGRLLSVTSPKEVAGSGRPYLTNAYDGTGRVIRQTLGDSSSANAMRTTLSYGNNGATVTNAIGEQTEYGLEMVSGFPVVRTKTVRGSGAGTESSWTITYGHNANTQVEQVRHPAGNVERYQFDGVNEPVTEGWIRNKGGVTYENDLTAGNLLAVIRESGEVGDGLSIRTSMTYERLFNQVASQTDGRGNVTSYEYDYTRVGYLGNPSRIKLPDIEQPDGTRVTVPATEYEYNESGQRVRSTMGGAREMTWTYDAKRYLASETFPSGATRTFSRDDHGRLLRKAGDFEDIKYDLNGFGEIVREIQDPDGFANVTEFRYDDDGGLIEARQQLKDNFATGPGAPPGSAMRWLSTRTDRDLIGRVVRETQSSDELSLTTEYSFGPSGQLASLTRPGPAGSRTEERYTYDARGLVTEFRIAPGTDQEVLRRSSHDPNGNEIRVEEVAVSSPEGTQPGPPRVTVHEYDGLDRLKATTDPLGARTEFTLDADGNPVSEWVAEGQGVQLARTERAFDQLGNLISEGRHVLDGPGTVVTSEIYRNGFLERVRTVGPAGGVAEYRYDAGGRVDRVVTPGNDTTYTTYDPAGRRTVVTQVETGERMEESGETHPVRSSSSVRYEYDALGRVVREQTENHDVRYFYDSLGNLRGTLLSDGTADSIRYDGLGRKIAHSAGRLTRTYDYGSDGLPYRMTDGNSTVEWVLDVHGRIAEETRTGSGRWTTARDGLGNPLRVTDANGTTITSTFNGVGLPLTQTIQTAGTAHPSGTQVVVAPSRIEWFYDVLGRVSEARSGEVITRMDYDGLGRIILEEQEVDGERYLFQKAYGPDQLSVTTTYPDQAGGLQVEGRLDVMGRMESVSAGDDWVARYTHDGPTRVSSRLYRNGVSTRYSLDDQGRLGRIEVGPVGRFAATHWTSTVDYGRFGLERMEQTWTAASGREGRTVTSMAFDDRGQVVRSSTLAVGGPSGSPTSRSRSSQYYEYADGRLVRSAETLFDDLERTTRYTRADGFAYDGAGRKTSVEITIGTEIPSPNQLLGGVPEVTREAQEADDRLDGRKDFEYDARGNLISDGELYYSYDHQGRLTWVEERYAPGERGEADHYLYDALGRRVRSFPLEGPRTTGLVSWGSWAREPSHFLYDGDYVVAEMAPAGTEGPSPVMKRRYVLGARPGERVRAEDFEAEGGVRIFYPHESVQSDVQFVTDPSGQPLSLAFSNPAGGPGITVPDDLRFVQGTESRAPYLSWTTRVDGFAGIKFDEMGGSAQLDYRSIRAFADSTAMRTMRENVATTMNDGAMALGAASTMMVASMVGAAVFTSGLTHLTWSGVATSVGVSSAMESLGGAAIAWYTDDPTYGPKTFFRDAGTGALFGLIGGRMTAAGWSIGRSIAGEQVIQNAFTTASGMALDGRDLGQAWSIALAESASEMVMGVGILSVARGAKGLGVRLQRNAAPRGQGSGIGGGTVHVSATGRDVRWGLLLGGDWRTGKFMSIAKGWMRHRNQMSAIMAILESGTQASRITARAIRDGELGVRFYYGEEPGIAGFMKPDIPGYIFINAAYTKRLPFGGGGPESAAAIIVHEAMHAFGGGEISSHVAQARFMFHRLIKTRALVGGQFYPNRAPWLTSHDINLLSGYWKGRRTGRFDELVDVMTSVGYGKDYLMQVNTAYSPRIQAAGGFGKMLGVDPHWADFTAKIFDPIRVVGHWDD